jgi:dephospho-CoA kinase
MKILGVTGLIASGKSFVCGIMRDSGIDVHDSDAQVARLWQADSPVFDQLKDLFPTAIAVDSGIIDRAHVADLIFKTPKLRQELESILYPALSENREAFIAHHKARDSSLIALDIPLLFEKNLEPLCDAVLATVAPEPIRKERALARPRMTQQRFDAIESLHYHDKHERADFVVDTHQSADIVTSNIHAIIEELCAI